MKLFAVLVTIVLGVNAGPAIVLNELRGLNQPFDTYGLPGASIVQVPQPVVSVQEGNDLEVPVNAVAPFGGQQLTLIPVAQPNPPPVASLVHEVSSVQPIAGNQLISVEPNSGAAPCPPQIVVVALPPQYAPHQLSPIPVQLPLAPVQKLYVPAPAPAPVQIVSEPIPAPAPQLVVEEPAPVVQAIEAPQPVQVVEQTLIAQPIEPCATDVREPEPAVYVAPPPAPALLELPPVVKPQQVVVVPAPVAVVEEPVVEPIAVEPDCGDAPVIAEPAPIAPIISEPLVPAPPAHIQLTVTEEARLPAPVYGIASPIAQPFFVEPAPAPVLVPAPAPAPVLIEQPKIIEQQIISAPYPPAVQEVTPIVAEPCAEPAPAPVPVVEPVPVQVIAPAPIPVPEPAPIRIVAPAPAPAPVVIDAPYPAALPFPTHYGEPALPLRYLLLNNSI